MSVDWDFAAATKLKIVYADTLGQKYYRYLDKTHINKYNKIDICFFLT